MYTLQFDGLFQRIASDADRYPGIMCYGWLIWHDDRLVAHGHGGYAHWQLATSNGAEYLALIAGLEALIELRATNEIVLIQGDAKTIIEQMQSRVLTHSPRVQQFRRQARRLCRNLKEVRWNWTPRRENLPADKLTRQAFQHIREDKPDLFTPDIQQVIPPESRRGLQPLLRMSTLHANSQAIQ